MVVKDEIPGVWAFFPALDKQDGMLYNVVSKS